MLQGPEPQTTQTTQTTETAKTTSVTMTEGASLQAEKDAAEKMYTDYAKSQQGFQPPVAHISVETEDENRTEVHIETQYGPHKYAFRSIQPSDADAVYQHLNSQPLVRAKYANKKTVDRAASDNRVALLSDRYNPHSKDGCYMYGGFIVSDAEAEDNVFLGLVNIGASDTDGIAEIARLNRTDAWSHSAKSGVVEEYKFPEEGRLKKTYQGLGTAETSVLFQYGTYLRAKDHKLKGKTLDGICATARIDNPGSWKSSAKLGFELTGIDSNPNYGPELRYQLRKRLKGR